MKFSPRKHAWRLQRAVIEAMESRTLLSTSTLVFAGPDGRLIYTPNAQGDRIYDFSQVGYMTGNIALPDTSGGVAVPVKATVNPGAAGVDMTATIQAAINSVQALTPNANGFRGAVLLTAGNYPISGQLNITAAGVVLEGAGNNKTTGTALEATGTSTRMLINVTGSGSRSTVSNTTHNITDSYVPVGATSFHLDSTTNLHVGDTIIVDRPSPENWIHDIGMDTLTIPWTAGSRNTDWDRTITAINGNQVTIDIPLTNSLDQKYGGGSVHRYTWTGRIAQDGVENLYAYSDSVSAADIAHAGGSVYFQTAINGYINNVTSDGFATNQIIIDTNTKWMTVDNTTIENTSTGNSAPPAGLSMNGQLGLAENITQHSVYHSVAITADVAGPNVIYNMTADGTLSETGPHQRWSAGGLFDNVKITGSSISIRNAGNEGTGHGWQGANYVLWNSSAGTLNINSPPTAQNWVIGGSGTKQGTAIYDQFNSTVQPQSLYLKQLWDRTHSNPTVATAAAATPNPLNGNLSVALSVLGADASLTESNLTYAWSTLSKPSGAGNPTFSANGTNAAKNSTATLSTAGTYIFQVTISDPDGLLATSNVVVTSTTTTVINGTTGADTIRIVRNGTADDVFVNGVLQLAQDFATSPELSINGLTGNDTITVDYSGGNPVPGAGLIVNGGGDSGDVVSLIGTSGSDAVSLSGGASASVNGGQFSYTGFNEMDLAMGSGADTLSVAGSAAVSVANMTLNVSGGGSLAMAASSTLPSFTDLNVTGATFDLSGQSQTIDAFNGSGTIADTGAAATLTVGSQNSDGNFSGTLQNGTGVLSLTKSGLGTLTLSGTNTYTGVSTINSGTIASGTAASFAGLTGQVRFNGGTFHVTADTIAANVSNKFTTSFSGDSSSSIGTFNIDSGVTLTIGGSAASLQTAGGGGTGGGFTKTGAGTLRILSNNSQQDTKFFLIQGTISAESATALGGGDAGVELDALAGTTLILKNDSSTNFLTPLVAEAGGTINVIIDRATPGIAVTHSLNSFSGLDGFTLNVTAGPNITSGIAGLTLGSASIADNSTFSIGTNVLTTISGALAGAFTVTKTSAGTLLLNGTNTYTTTTISAGALQIGNGGATGTLGTGNVTDNATLVFDENDPLTVANALSGSGSVQQIGAGTTILTAANSYATTTISAGTLQIDNGGTTGTLGSGAVTNNANLVFDRSDAITVANAISGSGSVQQIGQNVLTITGNNSYNGATSIAAGSTIQVINNNSLGAVPGGAVNISTGGTLDLSGSTTANALNFGQKQFNIAGTGVSGVGAIFSNSAVGQQNALQNVVLTADASIGGGSRFDIRAAQIGGQNVATLDLAGHTLTKIGADQISLVAVNVSDGNIIVNGGTLSIETTTSIPNNNTGTSITYNTGASAQFFQNTLNAGVSTINRPIVFIGSVLVGNAGTSLATIGSNITLQGDVTFVPLNNGAAAPSSNFPLTLTGNIGESGASHSITKNGVNTLTLNGVNTFTGATNVSAGTLQVNGSIAASSGVTVGSGANFIAGDTQKLQSLTINSGVASIVPGGNRVLTLNALSLTGTGSLDIQDNDVIVDYTGSSPISSIRGWLASGLQPGVGNWLGNGIRSTAASQNPLLYAIGYGEASTLGLSSFAGQSVDSSAVLIKFTYAGDVNLDGKVDVTDLGTIASHWQQTGQWTDGDFNYDGTIDVTDLGVIATNWQQGVSAPLAVQVVAATNSRPPSRSAAQRSPQM